MKTNQQTTDQGQRYERRYALRRGLGFWELTFEGRQAIFKHELGALYVACLLLAASPTSRRRAWCRMAGRPCYSSNAFCGPIQGEVKMKTIMPARAPQHSAKGPSTALQRRINAGWLRLWQAVYPDTPPPTRVQSLMSKVQSPGPGVQGPKSNFNASFTNCASHPRGEICRIREAFVKPSHA